MKKKVFNKRGMAIYLIAFIIAIILGAVDCDNMMIFITTKAIAIGLAIVLVKLIKYMPKKYVD